MENTDGYKEHNGWYKEENIEGETAECREAVYREGEYLKECKFIEGGVTAPRGFKASSALCHIKENRKGQDVALVASSKVCSAGGIFTRNQVKAECVKLDIARVKKGKAQAVIVNSGNANACTGKEGQEDAKRMARSVANEMGIDENNVLVCSTGVIGQRLPVEKIEASVSGLVSGLSVEGHTKAAEAIMTTDTKVKELAMEFPFLGTTVRLGAMCKGSGMIHLNLGTMICIITTDMNIKPAFIKPILRYVADSTFNCVSVDGDTSTNDTVLFLASGEAGGREFNYDDRDERIAFCKILTVFLTRIAKMIASDGEGATKLVECVVHGIKSDTIARKMAKAVISSNLVKAAMFGRDANCGRVLCALGNSGRNFSVEKCCVYFNSKDESVEVIHNGVGLAFDEEKAKRILSKDEVQIEVSIGCGKASGFAWGCDLTYDYVKINGDYRT